MPYGYVAAAAAVVGAAESYKSGQQASDASDYNAQVDARNAQLADERSQINVMEQEHANRYAEGAQRAAYGGSGVAMTGSPLDEMASMIINDNFKVQVAYFNGQVDVAHDQAQGAIDSMMASQEKTSGTAGAISGLANAVSIIGQQQANG